MSELIPEVGDVWKNKYDGSLQYFLKVVPL